VLGDVDNFLEVKGVPSLVRGVAKSFMQSGSIELVVDQGKSPVEGYMITNGKTQHATLPFDGTTYTDDTNPLKEEVSVCAQYDEDTDKVIITEKLRSDNSKGAIMKIYSDGETLVHEICPLEKQDVVIQRRMKKA
jgi:hypothetical protein